MEYTVCPYGNFLLSHVTSPLCVCCINYLTYALYNKTNGDLNNLFRKKKKTWWSKVGCKPSSQENTL